MQLANLRMLISTSFPAFALEGTEHLEVEATFGRNSMANATL